MKIKSYMLLLTLTTLSLFSQEKKKVVFGVKGGLNLSNVLFKTNQGVYNGNFKMGYQVGLFGKIVFGEKFYFVPELLFSSQGKNENIQLSYQDGGYTEPFEVKFIENNILMPLLLKYNPIENLNVFLGPQIDYLFFIKVVEENENIQDYDGEYLNDFNLGFVGGIGYDVNASIGIEVRYNYGFNRFDKVGREDGFKMNNSVWMLNINYSFNKKNPT